MPTGNEGFSSVQPVMNFQHPNQMLSTMANSTGSNFVSINSNNQGDNAISIGGTDASLNSVFASDARSDQTGRAWW